MKTNPKSGVSYSKMYSACYIQYTLNNHLINSEKEMNTQKHNTFVTHL